MFLAQLLAVIVSLLWSLLIFFLGKILSKPIQLRNFLGFNKEGDQPDSFANVSIWIENSGLVLQAYAVIYAVFQLSSFLFN